MYRNISASILVHKFNIIVEFGSGDGVSKVSTLYHEYIGSRTLHFLKVELDDIAKALCEGVKLPSTDGDMIVSLTNDDG